MVIAPEKFRDEELFETKDELEKKGNKITIASTKKGECVGILGGRAMAELRVDDVNANDYDAIIFVGGPGSSIYFDDERALRIAQEAEKKGKILGAICIAPVILANAGILKGRKATVFESGIMDLKKKGAKCTGEGVSVDGKIVTADGPRSAREFGKKIAELLS